MKDKKGQAAIEYITYFAFFLLVAASFSSLVFMQSGQELTTRTQERFKSTLFYISQSVIDVNKLSAHADFVEVNITLPTMVKGYGLNVSGDGTTGVVYGNTSRGDGSYIHYYIRTGAFDVDVCQEPGNKNKITIEGYSASVCP